MTFKEITEQLDQLSLDEQLQLLEVLSGRIRRSLQAADDGQEDTAEADEPTLGEIRAGLKQGLREAMRGEGIPLSQLLAELDDE